MVQPIPTLDSEHTQPFTPFSKERKDEIMYEVIKLSGGTILDGLTCNWSAERGFELPLTNEWTQAIREQNPSHQPLLQYHSMREFRFNDTIDGLYTKNCMRWWTTDEKEQFRILLEQAISQL